MTSLKDNETKTCPVCGKEMQKYTKRGTERKYCSPHCAGKVQINFALREVSVMKKYAPDRIKQCVICGKEFIKKGKRDLYCSNTCREKAKEIRLEQRPSPQAQRRRGSLAGESQILARLVSIEALLKKLLEEWAGPIPQPEDPHEEQNEQQ